LTLATANTYTGNTTVSAGTLNVTGSLVSTNVSTAAGATLNASGATNAGLALDGASTPARPTRRRHAEPPGPVAGDPRPCQHRSM